MKASRGFCCVGLDNPKNGINVGSVMRAAGCYESTFVAVSGPRPKLYIDRMKTTDTMSAHKHIAPLLRVEDLFDVVPFDCVPVAVDLVEGAISLPEYNHPERAFYIFGAEDATLGARVLDACHHRVMVPTRGCMNLAATVNVVLYDRLAKSLTT